MLLYVTETQEPTQNFKRDAASQGNECCVLNGVCRILSELLDALDVVDFEARYFLKCNFIFCFNKRKVIISKPLILITRN